MVTIADGFAEREAAKTMINDARQAADNTQAEVTLGADKVYDAKEFIYACLEMNVIPHAAQNTSGRRGAGCNRCQCGLRYLSAEKKTHRAGFRVGKDRGAHPAGDGARIEEGRSDVCADHGGLQSHAHAHAGKNPSADGVKGGKCGEMGIGQDCPDDNRRLMFAPVNSRFNGLLNGRAVQQSGMNGREGQGSSGHCLAVGIQESSVYTFTGESLTLVHVMAAAASE